MAKPQQLRTGTQERDLRSFLSPVVEKITLSNVAINAPPAILSKVSTNENTYS